MHTRKKLLAGALTAAATGAAVIGISVSSADSGSSATTPGTSVAATAAVASGAVTATPIKHVVVLFDENVSFDHYFGTYPHAENLPGENPFAALPNTPSVNGLDNTLLTANPNEYNPARLAPSQALTCDMNHSYTPEQAAFDNGAMDAFVQNTTGAGCTQGSTLNSGSYGPGGIDMDYYDGNTVTGLWNLAQHFTLNDNSYDTQFGPSSPGAINVVSGNTTGAVAEGGASSNVVSPTDTGLSGTLTGDAEPYFDECSNASTPSTSDYPGTTTPAPGGVTVQLTTKNIGDDLDSAGLTWGWFQGGFTPSSYTTNGTPVCGTTHTNIGGATVTDYSEHHEPFQYYASTSNPQHLSPADTAQVGTDLPAGVNHQYDLTWFNQALAAGDMPAVSYLKAPEYEDGHAGYSDPIDEQRFLVNEIDQIEQSPQWSSTAIFIAYDDSDGWYDHQAGPILRGSNTPNDAGGNTKTGVLGKCGDQSPAETGLAGADTDGRCGVGPRLPLLVISPYARQNYVDNTFTDQSSIPKFIEQNWGLPALGQNSTDATAGTLMNAFDFTSGTLAPAIIMNPNTGEIEQTIPTTPGSGGTSTTSSTTSTTTTTSSSTTTTTGTATGTGSGSGSGNDNGNANGNANGNDNGNNNGATVSVTVNGGSGSPAGSAAHAIMAPRVALAERFRGDVMTLVATAKGGSAGVSTQLRARVYRGRHLIGNEAARLRGHRATFRIALHHHTTGTFRALVTADTAGKVTLIRRSIRR